MLFILAKEKFINGRGKEVEIDKHAFSGGDRSMVLDCIDYLDSNDF